MLFWLSNPIAGQVSTRNYIRTRTMLNETGSSYMDLIVYYDGLGRPFQTVFKGITPSNQNLVSLQEFDEMGRESKSWLPVVSTSDYVAAGDFISNAPGSYNNDSRPYYQSVYEFSPLNRMVQQYGPGVAWHSGHSVTTEYLVNTTISPLNCINYSVNSSGSLVNNGNYASSRLYVTKTIDEDDNIGYVFIDKLERVVLTRQMKDNVPHDTYYVYDDYGNLSFVLQPMYQDNKNLSYGFLTGILRIAQESIFSGLNNLTVNSVMDEAYDRYFGFTNEEVSKMLEYYGVAEKESELQEWYDGYLFGNEEIYNPWSVINYISKGCVPQAYWVNTGKNEILEDVLKVADEDITEKLYSLIRGDKVLARIDQNVVYRSLTDDPANIYSLLLVAGYLKTTIKELQADGSYLCQVSIPNKEIASVYKSEVLAHLMQIGAVSRTTADKIAESLFLNDYVKLEKAISEYMNKAISFYDTASESFYHGLILGLISMMDNQYKIKSNRESGKGRFDIGLIPRDDKLVLRQEKGLIK